MGRGILGAAMVAAIGVSGSVEAGISYTTVNLPYSENFNGPSLPTGTNPFNGIDIQYNNTAQIQNGNAPFPGGWKDDSVTDATYLSVPGWHLYHERELTTATGGDNGHHQMRYGSGGTGTSAAFYVWAMPVDYSEKALGILSSPAINAANGTSAGGRAYIGLQLTNDTGMTLTSFTVTYDGEQWRDARDSSLVDGFDLQYSLAKTDANWFDSSGYDGIADSFLSVKNTLDEVAPITGQGLDGNLPENRVENITHTISGIEWLPGTELWIRWRDRELGNVLDDSIAIDNVRFSAAVPEPTTAALLLVGGTAALMRRCRRD